MAREEKLARRNRARDIVSRGVCPKCGQPLLPHPDIRGLWLCAQNNAEELRADRTLPGCNVQTFTE